MPNKTLGKILIRNFNKYIFSILLLISIISIYSCADTKHLTYFNVPEDTNIDRITMPEDLVIQNNDILGISITSLSAEAAAIYNPGNVIVNSDGTIQIPVLGSVKAAGITKNELRSRITNELTQRKLLVEPTVTIQFINTRITVLGEVGNPGILAFSNDRLSIVEAMGLAGDLPMTADKRNVLLIREEGGKKIFRHLDLTNRNIFTSPYYYLKSNDVVYVQPTKSKIKSETEPRVPSWLMFAMSTLSFVLGIALIFLNK
ncbi:MAG TPA: polysaccharide biosynthesis/export family protein [Chitinophagaceae bacterium]|nr:polysaccharide biosynthesis/export family protein [Chitinophagaceae bacterium]